MSYLLHSVIPASNTGGSRFGFHFLRDWSLCPYLFAIKHLAPMTNFISGSSGHGLNTIVTPPAILSGSGFHDGMDAWYTSRCKTGEDNGQADLDFAIESARQSVLNRKYEYSDEAMIETDISFVTSMLTRYHEQYGPDGYEPEFPGNLQVACDDLGPLIEREYEINLGFEDFVFTSRIDLQGYYQGLPGIVGIEHKTSAPSYVYRTASGASLNGQFTGESFTMTREYGTPLPRPVLVNIINKQPAKKPTEKSPPRCYRSLTTRTSAELNKFHADVVNKLIEIEDHLQRYDRLITTQGVEPYEAISRIFPRKGVFNGSCEQYNRPCMLAPICTSTGNEASAVGQGFRPRYRTMESGEVVMAEEQLEQLAEESSFYG